MNSKCMVLFLAIYPLMVKWYLGQQGFINFYVAFNLKR